MYKLMIVAHPDDEILWGYDFFKDNPAEWKILCVTNGTNKERSDGFKRYMKYQHIGKHEIWNFEDNEHKELSKNYMLYKKLENEINPNYIEIVTHNFNGEYGHPHHASIYKMVTTIIRKKQLKVLFGMFTFVKHTSFSSNRKLYKEYIMKQFYTNQLPVLNDRYIKKLYPYTTKTYYDCLSFKVLKGKGNSTPKKGLISFSIYSPDGKRINEIYLKGIVQNVYLATKVYPGWVVRLYIDEHVPSSIIQKVLSMPCELYVHQQAPNFVVENIHMKKLWRFLPSCENYHVICRDVDSRLNIKESSAVDEWLLSGQKMHRMFDSVYHKNPLLAGMIGFSPNTVPNIHELIMKFEYENKNMTPNIDEIFLEKFIYPIFKRSGKTHRSNDFKLRMKSGFVGEQIHPLDYRVSSDKRLLSSFL
jgi:hypothetical protein